MAWSTASHGFGKRYFSLVTYMIHPHPLSTQTSSLLFFFFFFTLIASTFGISPETTLRTVAVNGAWRKSQIKYKSQNYRDIRFAWVKLHLKLWFSKSISWPLLWGLLQRPITMLLTLWLLRLLISLKILHDHNTLHQSPPLR